MSLINAVVRLLALQVIIPLVNMMFIWNLLWESALFIFDLGVSAYRMSVAFAQSPWRPIEPATQQPVEEWLRIQRSRVDFSFLGTPRLPLQARLTLRAQANRRLVSAFGIANSLTTSSPEVHTLFLKEASRVLGVGGGSRWPNLYSVAEFLLERDVDTMKGQNSPLSLADCAQRLCLTVVLVDNFGIDARDIPPETARFIATEINRQWLYSKCDASTAKSEDLNTTLRDLGLRAKDGPVLTPEQVLGIVMPQYETLWRVVLLTFVTAYHRQLRPENISRGADVPDCLGDPNREAEAVKLAKEGLRLYPSNKRIYRASTIFADILGGDTVNANVEVCQRDARIWGADALDFRPERFDSLSELQSQAYFPYSLRPHRCPAYSGFGNRMVTMLVVVMGRVFPPPSWTVRFNNEDLDRDPAKALPTGRDDMEGWVLERQAAIA